MGYLNNFLSFLGIHEADTSTHGVTTIDGVTERDAAIAAHTSDKTSIHAFDSDGLLTAMPGVNKSQIILDSGTANRKGSIFLHNTDEFYLTTNCYHNGTSWMRFDTTVIAEILAMEPNIGIRVYRASAGANPIASWDLANGIVISGTDGKVPDASLESPVSTHAGANVSATVHPNANTHIGAAAPHSGHETPTGAQSKVDTHAGANVSATVHPNALFNGGNYAGNNTVNRAIPHGLGRTPKCIMIVGDSHTKAWIFTVAAIYYEGGTAYGVLAVTVPDATNFYVGNATNYDQSANATGYTYYWMAW